MSKKTYTLQVPADKPEGFPEFVSQGNFEADLTKETVETTEPNFAKWLVAEYGLVDISDADASKGKGVRSPHVSKGSTKGGNE